jgi:hypothetical protein
MQTGNSAGIAWAQFEFRIKLDMPVFLAESI